MQTLYQEVKLKFTLYDQRKSYKRLLVSNTELIKHLTNKKMKKNNKLEFKTSLN